MVRAAGYTWELDLGGKKELRDTADKLKGKRVVVAGELTLRRGVYVGPRHVVVVASLKAEE